MKSRVDLRNEQSDPVSYVTQVFTDLKRWRTTYKRLHTSSPSSLVDKQTSQYFPKIYLPVPYVQVCRPDIFTHCPDVSIEFCKELLYAFEK